MKPNLPIILLTAGLATSALGGDTVPAPEPVTPPSPMDWLTGADLKADLRLRYEYGEQDPLDESHAGTLRSRIGILSGTYKGIQGFAEYEGTITADRNSYQAASVHGLGQNKTIIADPESHELNQLWLSFTDWVPETGVKVGRQAINLDGQRYVGTVAWRQNMQTFDAVSIESSIMDGVTLTYAYINHVDRIFGSGDIRNPGQTDFDGNSHIIHTGWEWKDVQWKAFAMFLDLGNDAGDANSNNSYGLSATGKAFEDSVSWYAEYGYQTDAFDSPRDYGTHYFHLNGGTKVGPIGVTLGYEYLGSDNGVGYNFPLGTNHKFNGFADKFLGTPGNGLQDLYIKFGAPLPGDFNMGIWYHKFFSVTDSFDYGHEVDFVITRQVTENLQVLAKFAHYWAEDAPFTDTTRFSIEANYTF